MCRSSIVEEEEVDVGEKEALGLFYMQGHLVFG
jgi:hypothetical protein